MSQILVRESFLKGFMFVPNFMKIKRGPNFFFVDLVWNDPYIIFSKSTVHCTINFNHTWYINGHCTLVLDTCLLSASS